MFFLCMKLPTPDLQRSEVQRCLQKSTLVFAGRQLGQESLSLPVAFVAHLQTRLTGLCAWGNFTANFDPKRLHQRKPPMTRKEIRADV